MPSPVPHAPEANVLARQVVGAPVSGAAHVGRWARDLAALIGYLQPVPVADVFLPAGGAGTDTVKIAYAPSIGPTALYVAVEFHAASAAGATGTTTVSTAGALAGAVWIAANRLDGAGAIAETNQTLQEYPIVEGLLDITGCAHGTAGDITITHVDAGLTCKGIRRVRVLELPLGALDPVGSPAVEPAVDQSWCTAGNPIVDGSSAVGRGLYRVIAALDVARNGLKRHWQIAALEASSTARCYSTTSAAFANPAWVVHAQTPTWRLRARRLYASPTKNKGSLRVRFACSNAAATGTLRFIVTPVGGAATNFDVTCAAGGSTAFQVATLASVDLDVTGTNQELDIAIQAKVSAGTLFFSNVLWLENEP